MEHRILLLGRALRDAGAPVSTPEILDASRAALAVGVDRREDLRAALRATLVKRWEHVPEFESHFDRLFPAGIPRLPKRSLRRGTSRDSGVREGAARAAGGAAPSGQRAEVGNRSPHPLRRAGEDEKVSTARRERPEAASPGRPPEPDDRDQSAHGESPVRSAEPSAIPRLVPSERRRLLAKGFRERWDGAEERAAAEAMEDLARRLANRLSRRRCRAKRGAVDCVATLRANLVHGGVPFALRRKARVPGRRDLVLLVDVSGSVRRASSLFLLILGRLRDRFTGVRAFAYVDRPAEIPAALGARSPAEIAASLASDLAFDALSDHGETFRRFNRDFAGAVGGRSIVILLGDARNNRFDPQEWELERIRRRCHRLVWIVPEPKTLWGSADSAIAAYAPHCHQVIAAPTPAALAEAANKILSSA